MSAPQLLGVCVGTLAVCYTAVLLPAAIEYLPQTAGSRTHYQHVWGNHMHYVRKDGE